MKKLVIGTTDTMIARPKKERDFFFFFFKL
jgi:hypothetical protein